MTIADFLRLSWDEPGDALIEPPAASPIVADPSFLFPSETPDGRWALVAHDAWGLRLYRSDDGLSWDAGRRIIRHAMRPFIRRLGGEYRLYFERYRPFALVMTALPARPRWRSSVACAVSAELSRWGAADELIAPELAWMRDARLGFAASNPCLAEDGDALDVLVMVNEPTFSGCLIETHVVGLFRMIDRGRPDYKVLGVPNTDPLFAHIRDINDVPYHFLREVEHFFATYKQLEGVEIRTEGWAAAEEAVAEVRASVERHRRKQDECG